MVIYGVLYMKLKYIVKNSVIFLIVFIIMGLFLVGVFAETDPSFESEVVTTESTSSIVTEQTTAETTATQMTTTESQTKETTKATETETKETTEKTTEKQLKNNLGNNRENNLLISCILNH